MDQPIGRAVHHLQADLTGGHDEYRRWCDEHHREVLRRGGYLSLRRFEAVTEYPYATPGTARHLTVYELDDETAADATTPGDEAPMPPAVTGLTFTRTVYRQLSPPLGAFTASGVTDGGVQPIGTALLNVMIDVEPDYDAEYNAWYNEEHLPALVEVSGVLSARRFVDAHGPGPGRHQYLSLYQLEDPTVVSSEGFAKAGAPSERSRPLSPHRSTSVGLYRQVFFAIKS
jgi:hypothetical protein